MKPRPRFSAAYFVPAHWRTTLVSVGLCLRPRKNQPSIGWPLSFSALYLSPLRYSPPLGPGFTRHPSPTHPDPFPQVCYSNSK